MAADAAPTPDFLVIGAMKCATSTVCAYLEDHPDVFMVAGCEPNYFSHDENWAKGPDWYASFFAPRAGERIAGEGSNAYSATQTHPQVVARIAATAPDAKLIYMVRDPVARIASAWLQNRADKGDAVPPSLDEAVRRMPERYVGDSLYWRRLSDYRARFSDERIFIGFMEDMTADQPAFMAQLCAFLDIAPDAPVRRSHVNPSSGKRAPGALYTRLRALPGMGAIKALTPAPLRRWARRELLSQRHDVPPRFSPAVLSELVETLTPDTRELLAFAGKPADFWPMRG